MLEIYRDKTGITGESEGHKGHREAWIQGYNAAKMDKREFTPDEIEAMNYFWGKPPKRQDIAKYFRVARALLAEAERDT